VTRQQQESEFLSSLSEQLRHAREKAGWTEAELACRAGVDVETVKRLECGVGGRVLSYRSVAAAYGLSLRGLLTGAAPADVPAEAEEGKAFLRRVGSRVRHQRRTERTWTVAYLAGQAGVSADTVSLLERGLGDARMLTYRRLAAALDYPLSDLLAEGQPSNEGSIHWT